MEKSSFFNSVGGDRRYDATDWAEYFASFIGNGVFGNPENCLAAVPDGGMRVALLVGSAWINGYFYVNTARNPLALDIADGVLKRIDRVVLQWNLADRCILAKVKKGASAMNPVAPALQRDASVYELCVAEIHISAGATSIVEADIVDKRRDATLCGTVISVVSETHDHDLNSLGGTLNIEKGGTGQTTAAGVRNTLGLGNTTGALPVANGGTGQTSLQATRNAMGLGNTTAALPIANGGTGQTTAAAVRNALGLGNTTGALPVANGGSGATDAASARSNLGVPPTSHASSATSYGVASAANYGHAKASGTAPKAHGTAATGSETATFARGDHVHPAQTSISGNAGTATQLQTARTINGASFNGTGNITFGALYPTEIPANVNLDSYTQSGLYFCPANATAGTLTNRPTANAFMLLVGRHAGTFQMVIEYMVSGAKVFFRNYYSSWGSWSRLYTTIDAPTTISGNAATATTLQTTRAFSITGGATAAAVNFNGNGNVALNVTGLNMANANAGTLPVARGGTGQTTAAGIRNSLGLGNTTGALPVANGGTGQTTAAGIRNSLGLGNTTGVLPAANGGTGQASLQATRSAMGLGNTTGALPIANGGTGATSAKAAMNALGIFYAATLPTSGTDGQICLVPV